MSMPVDDKRNEGHHEARSSGGAAAASVGVDMPMPMVRCNAMAWTDETEKEGRLEVLVTRRDQVAGTLAVTEE
jgi:hypothetical protein